MSAVVWSVVRVFFADAAGPSHHRHRPERPSHQHGEKSRRAAWGEDRVYAEDVRQTAARGPFRAVYLLDVLHHIPSADQVDVVRQLTDMLEEGGTLVIKDITTKPWFGLKFTEILDRAMVGMKKELTYRHHNRWNDLLRDLGYQVRVVRVPDVLPYPHVIIAATKGSKPATTSAVLN